MCSHELENQKTKKTKKGKDMNIERETNMQELPEANYTKVYAGTNAPNLLTEFYKILPIGPLKPKKPEVKD